MTYFHNLDISYEVYLNLHVMDSVPEAYFKVISLT